MAKSTIIRVADLSRSAELPPSSRVVLDFAGEPYAAARVQGWKDAGLTVLSLIGRAQTVGDPTLASFAEQGDPTVLIPRDRPSVAEAMAALPLLRRSHITIELPLRDEADLDVLKVLASLEVRTRVPFADLASANEAVRDTMDDALLRPGPRATVTPFAEMQALFLEDGFEIARLDYRDNDHFVDLRLSDAERPRADWDEVRVDQKRVPFLLDKKPCAFCEGLLFCHGYLARPDGDLEACRAMMSEFVELHNLARGRGGAMSPRSPSGATERTR